jgi:predicted Zn-dependent protease
MNRPTQILTVAALALLAGCYTVPQTGRKSFIVLPASQEASMGATAFLDIKSKEKISSDPVANGRVTRIGERIAAVASDDLPDAKWEFVVFDEPETVNAFALPGGKVGVYTGLLKLAASDDEIAVVMGHEIAHATARHGSERWSQSAAVAVGGALLSETVLKDNKNREGWLAAYGAGATVGVLLPYSRLNESEADEIGLVYAARAGYDPRAAITFWEKMAAVAAGKGKPPEFLSTHPSDETRIRRLREMMPRILPLYEAAR